MTCRPGHPARHPDFEPGNLVALKHGARSEQRIREIAAEHRPGLLESCPWLNDDSFSDALRRYLRAEARAELLNRAVTEIALSEGGSYAEGVKKVPQYLWQAVNAADRLAAQLSARLGLDVVARAGVLKDASLARHFAPDLAQLWAEEGQ